MTPCVNICDVVNEHINISHRHDVPKKVSKQLSKASSFSKDIFSVLFVVICLPHVESNGYIWTLDRGQEKSSSLADIGWAFETSKNSLLC